MGNREDDDRTLQNATRLDILLELNRAESLTFLQLLDTLHINHGALSAHAIRLERAGYVSVTKSFVNRKTETRYKITPAGRIALRRYLEGWAKRLEAAG